MFYIYAINIINQIKQGDISSYYISCEVSERGKDGGEYFMLNVIETKDEEKFDTKDRDTLYVNKFNKNYVKNVLQKLINDSKAKNWNELSVFISRWYKWGE